MPGSPDLRRDGVTPGATGTAAMLVAICLMFGPPALTARSQGPLDVEPEGLQPGLIAVYRPLVAGGRALHRVEPKPAFTLGRSSPHPRIPARPVRGRLGRRPPGPRPRADRVLGVRRRRADVEVDGVKVLRGAGRSETSRLGPSEPLTRAPGHYRLTVRYRSLADVPARLQIWWEGPTFAREPLPAWRLGHLPESVTPDWPASRVAGRGRDAVGRLGCARCHRGAFPGVTDPPPGPSLADAGRRLGPRLAARLAGRPGRGPARGPHAGAVRAGPDGVRGTLDRRRLPAAGRATTARTKRRRATTGGAARVPRRWAAPPATSCPDLDRAGQADPDRVAFDRPRRPDERRRPRRVPGQPARPLPRRPDAPAAGRAGRGAGHRRVPAAVVEADAEPARGRAADGRGDSATSAAGSASRDAIRRPPRPRCCARRAVPPATPGSATAPRDVPIQRAGRRLPRGRGRRRAAITRRRPTRGRRWRPTSRWPRARSPVAVRRAAAPARAGRLRPLPPARQRPAAADRGDRQTLGGAFLQTIPFQRTPRLTNPHQKLTRSYLADAVREGVSGLRSPRVHATGCRPSARTPTRWSRRWPRPTASCPPRPTRRRVPVADPTLGTLHGPELVGFQGYGCVSCHVWNGRAARPAGPGRHRPGPDPDRRPHPPRLVRPLPRRPGAILPGHADAGDLPARQAGDAARRPRRRPGEAEGRPLGLPRAGQDAPARAAAPAADRRPRARRAAAGRPGPDPLARRARRRVALPARPATTTCWSTTSPPAGRTAAFTGGRILRNVQGRIRQFLADGTRGRRPRSRVRRCSSSARTSSRRRRSATLHGYDRLADGVRLRSRAAVPGRRGRGRGDAPDPPRRHGRASGARASTDRDPARAGRRSCGRGRCRASG